MRKILLIAAGLLSVLLGLIGVVLPGLPTTPFLLLAAACFAKSSPRLHRRLLENKLLGPLIKNWEETRSIPKRAKTIAFVMIAMVAVHSVWMLDTLAYKVLLLMVLIFPVVFLWRLPVTESLAVKQESADRVAKPPEHH